MAYNPIHKLTDNIAAIRIALGYKSGDVLSGEDQQTLRKYAGFGGIKAILYPDTTKDEWLVLGAKESDLRLFEEIKILHQLLRTHFNEQQYRDVVASLRESVLTAFYTPAIVPQTLYTVLSEQGIKPTRLYEPSAGAGIFIDEAIKAFPGLQQVTAVEKDLLTGKILQALQANADVPTQVHITGLEETPDKENGQYDLVVSNIPFGNFKVYDANFTGAEYSLITSRIHNYFFAKGLDKLRDGGLMGYITTEAFLNTPANQPARN